MLSAHRRVFNRSKSAKSSKSSVDNGENIIIAEYPTSTHYPTVANISILTQVWEETQRRALAHSNLLQHFSNTNGSHSSHSRSTQSQNIPLESPSDVFPSSSEERGSINIEEHRTTDQPGTSQEQHHSTIKDNGTALITPARPPITKSSLMSSTLEKLKALNHLAYPIKSPASPTKPAPEESGYHSSSPEDMVAATKHLYPTAPESPYEPIRAADKNAASLIMANSSCHGEFEIQKSAPEADEVTRNYLMASDESRVGAYSPVKVVEEEAFNSQHTSLMQRLSSGDSAVGQQFSDWMHKFQQAPPQVLQAIAQSYAAVLIAREQKASKLHEQWCNLKAKRTDAETLLKSLREKCRADVVTTYVRERFQVQRQLAESWSVNMRELEITKRFEMAEVSKRIQLFVQDAENLGFLQRLFCTRKGLLGVAMLWSSFAMLRRGFSFKRLLPIILVGFSIWWSEMIKMNSLKCLNGSIKEKSSDILDLLKEKFPVLKFVQKAVEARGMLMINGQEDEGTKIVADINSIRSTSCENSSEEKQEHVEFENTQ